MTGKNSPTWHVQGSKPHLVLTWQGEPVAVFVEKADAYRAVTAVNQLQEALQLKSALQWLLDEMWTAGETHDPATEQIYDCVEDAAAALVEAGGRLEWYSLEDLLRYRGSRECPDDHIENTTGNGDPAALIPTAEQSLGLALVAFALEHELGERTLTDALELLGPQAHVAKLIVSSAKLRR